MAIGVNQSILLLFRGEKNKNMKDRKTTRKNTEEARTAAVPAVGQGRTMRHTGVARLRPQS